MLAKTKEKKATGSLLDKMLNTVESIGNKVPHPSIIFLLLIGFVVVLSQIFGMLGATATYEVINSETLLAEEVTVGVTSLLSVEGIRFMLTSTVGNLMSFNALGVTLVAMVGVGFCEEIGLISVLIHKLVKVVPASMITGILVLLGVMSSIASDAGYLVLIPLGAAVFYKMGRHPIAGLSAAFAGVSAGFGVNLFITPIDGMLTEILNDGMKTVNPAYTIDLMANFYFSIASTILITIVCTLVNEKLIEPRLGKYESQEDLFPEETDNEVEKKGLRYALIALIAVVGVICLITLPNGAPLRHPETNQIIGSTPFMDSLMTLVMIMFLIPSIAYGVGVGKVKSSLDVVQPIIKVFGNLSGLIFLLLIISQFVAFFNFTNLGTVLAVNAADIIRDMNMSPLALLLCCLLLFALLDFILVGAIPKFAILTPIFIPLLYQLGLSPAGVLAAYRVADSPINIITPLMPYFALIVTFAAKYQKKTGVGSIVALMLPHSVAVMITWVILFVAFYVFNIPLGPGVGFHL
ncbi:AbgT family transporter [Enterococcus nangangensis]|uniref:AbgT family transporter n=1 Tax=Enterococcus nangangensis TaxID=2559926 RepID=UPI0010F85498|nr:AbgT family transporter [Enterococcus nangangensis]